MMLVAVLGLIVGSFANVCIYRLPLGKSIVHPASACPVCNRPIAPYDNIPLVSYIILWGRCRHCRTKISLRYPLVELLNALLYIIALLEIGSFTGDRLFRLIEAFYLSTAFLIVFFVDIDHRIIPDSISLSGIVIGILFSFLPGIPVNWKQALIGTAMGGGLFLLVAEIGDRVFKRESMGGGDIKLAAMLGASLGWQGILLVLCLASFLGSIVGLTQLALARDKSSARIVPFGPFLVTAGLVVFYRGPEIIRFYLKSVGLL